GSAVQEDGVFREVAAPGMNPAGKRGSRLDAALWAMLLAFVVILLYFDSTSGKPLVSASGLFFCLGILFCAARNFLPAKKAVPRLFSVLSLVSFAVSLIAPLRGLFGR